MAEFRDLIQAITGKGPILHSAKQEEVSPDPIRRVPFADPTPSPNMTRLDGTPKYSGWHGNIPMTGEHEGNHMSELSVGVPGTEEGFYPLIVPGSTPEELAHLAAGGEATPEQFAKARAYATQRESQGLSPFKNARETPLRDVSIPLPEPSRPYPRTVAEAEGFVPEAGHHLQTIIQARKDQDYLLSEEKRLNSPYPKHEQDQAKRQVEIVGKMGYEPAWLEWQKKNPDLSRKDFANWLTINYEISKGQPPRPTNDAHLFDSRTKEHIQLLHTEEQQKIMMEKLKDPNRAIEDTMGASPFPKSPRFR